jgi:hypothetical protein
MDPLARLLRLPRAERRVALASAALLPLVAVGLRVSGCRAMIALLRLLPRRAKAGGCDPRRTAAIVARIAAAIPGQPQCLVRALVLAAILRREGRDARLRIGACQEAGVLAAHAWVELDGSPVGDSPCIAQRFLPLVGAGADLLRA